MTKRMAAPQQSALRTRPRSKFSMLHTVGMISLYTSSWSNVGALAYAADQLARDKAVQSASGAPLTNMATSDNTKPMASREFVRLTTPLGAPRLKHESVRATSAQQV
eukprot:scaffold306352_cov27-Tisochrysis_lutea.AAC.1